MTPPSGIVGRFVSCEVKRGETTAPEVCEVVACQAAGDHGNWHLLVATHDGSFLEVGPHRCKLVGSPGSPGNPYR